MMGNQILTAYLSYCKLQKNLDSKTIKAYSIDLNQFSCLYPCPTAVSRSEMEQYIEYLTEKRIRKAWKVMIEYDVPTNDMFSDSFRNQDLGYIYYIDATTGEVIGGEEYNKGITIK